MRDGTHPPGHNEFPDTSDRMRAEKGWVSLMLTRLVEGHRSHSSTCAELIQAGNGASFDEPTKFS